MGLIWQICTSARLVPEAFDKSAWWKVSATETSVSVKNTMTTLSGKSY
jgi:hypothetical protein